MKDTPGPSSQGPSSSTPQSKQDYPGKGNSLSKRYGNATVFRNAAAPGSVNAAYAGSVLDQVASNSTGAAMEPAVQGSMEQGFGRSFADVRVHSDGPANQAAQDLNANAFTVGNDVFFDKGAYAPGTSSGKHLLAHELAHVTQGQAVAASSYGVSVSSPADPQEMAADAAADAVVQGKSAPALGGPPASVVQRDGLGELNEAAEGNWLLGVDQSEIWRRIAALSPAEARNLARSPDQAALLSRVCAQLSSVADYQRLFREIPYFTLERKLQLLAQAGLTDSLSSAQWDALVAAASDAEKQALPSMITASRAIARSKATPAQLLAFFQAVPYYNLSQKFDLLSHAGVIAALSAANCTALVDGLSADELGQLGSTARYMPLLAQMCQVFSVAQIFPLFDRLGSVPVGTKIRLLQDAGKLAGLTRRRWESLIGFASPDDIAAMRGDPAVYALFLQNAPNSVLGPRDRIEQLLSGAAAPSPAALQAQIAGLSGAQKAEIRGDNTMVQRIVDAAAGAAVELFIILTDLDVEPKWMVHWLDRGGVIGALSNAQWGQIVGEASDDEMAALAGWDEVNTLYEANCPESIRQTRGQESVDDPEAFTRSLTRAKVRSLFDELGPAGFLGLVTQDGMDVKGNYQKIDRANYLRRTINGLAPGAAMGARAAENLKTWFFDCDETRLNVIEAMFEARFNVKVRPDRADSQAHNDSSTRLARWTVEGLQASWPVMEALPPDQVEGNPSWDDHFRNSRSGNGNAYYWNNGVVMGLQNGDDITEQSTDRIYQEGGQYQGVRDPATGDWVVPPSPEVDMPTFSATLRHEIGHAVDEALGIMNRWQSHENTGAWRNYASAATFVQTIINDYGGLGTAAAPKHGYPGNEVGDYQQAMVDAVSQQIDFLDALKAVRQANGNPAPVEPLVDAGPISVVMTTSRWAPDGDPWYGSKWTTTPTGRNYHMAYDDLSTLYSFKDPVRQAKGVTDYQWRAPGEWFAEVYQVYYAEQEADPNAAVGGMLRARDAEAANLIANFVDRGHSPQEMRGGTPRHVATTVPAPGTTRGGS